jgi:hypothetical protein
MRGIRRGALLAATSAAVALTAATAIAGPGSTVSKSTRLSGDGPASRGAICPIGTRMTGNGFSIADAFNPRTDTGTRSMIQSSHRTGIRASSAVASMQAVNQPATTLRSYVRCIRSTKGPTVIAFGDVDVAPGTIQTANADCPADTKAVGGGFRATPPFRPPLVPGKAFPLILESRRVGAQVWRSTLINPAPTSTASVNFSFYALCEPDRNGATKVRRKTVPVGPDSRKDIGVRCPRNWHTASGGFRLGPIAPTDFLFGFMDRSRPQGSRVWKAGAWTPASLSEPEGGFLTVYAYCKRN